MTSQYKDFVISVLEKAAVIARSNFGKVAGTTKVGDSNQVLTETDLEIGHLLVALIKQKFPNHNLIDEESGVLDNHSEFTWIVDPVDGTSNFAQGLPQYGIVVGLIQNDKPICGGVSLPKYNEVYFAEKGSGAFCNDQPIHVSSESKLINSLVAYGIDGHQENPQFTKDECRLLADIVLGIRNLRSSNSVYDHMQVARGKYGGYLSRSSRIWDNVAQHVIIEEAGGVYTDFLGKPMDYSSPLTKVDQNYSFCTGSKNLHEQLLNITKTSDDVISPS